MTFVRLKKENDQFISFDISRTGKQFLFQVFRTIFIPYIIWGIISILIYSVMGRMVTTSLELTQSNFRIFQNLIGLFYGNSASGYFEWNRPLWFLTCLFSIEIICFFILKVIKNRKEKQKNLYILMAISLSFLLSTAIAKWHLILPFELETAGTMFFFFGIGLVIRNQNRIQCLTEFIDMKLRGWKSILLMIMGIIITVSLALLNGSTDTRTDYFGNPFLFVITALAAVSIVLYISRLLKRNVVMEYIGKRTLAILAMHKFPIMFFKMVIPKLNEQILSGNLLVEILLTIGTIILCLIAERLIMVLVPEMFGKRRKKVISFRENI